MLQLLGASRLNNKTLPFDKTTFLITLLACREDWVTRDEIILLFWDDADEGLSRQRLRQLVYRARQMGHDIEADPQRLRFVARADVRDFRAAIKARDWHQAVALYEGELLRGATLPDQPELESWFELEREELVRDYRRAVLELSASQSDADALETLELALRRDALSEELLRGLLERSSHASDVGLRAFERFKRELAQRWQMVPSAELITLAEQLSKSRATAKPRVTPRSNTLPVAVSAFVGRQAELDWLSQRFLDPLCRLVTLVGPGGAGKTRLALEFAARWANQLADGVYFVDLTPLSDAAFVCKAILEAIGERDQGDPIAQIATWANSRQAVLVLDNFEHVISAREAIHDLFERAGNLRLIVTSREALGLRAEFTLDVNGLPAPDLIFSLENQDAAVLLTKAAQRVRFDFHLTPADQGAFTRIYQAVNGLPLGLELAAGWVRQLSLSDIASELERSLEHLEFDAPDIPERQRSFAAVFASSWRLLRDDERGALARMSVFRGGFTKALAARVANASLPILLRLVGKSLVAKREARFTLHEMIRQFAEMHLLKADRTEALRALSEALLEQSEHWYARNFSNDQSVLMKQLETEHDNIRTILDWSLGNDVQLGARITGNLEHFWYTRGHHREGASWAARYLEAYPTRDQTRLRVIWTQASLSKELSQYDAARSAADEYLELAIVLGDDQAHANAEKFLGLLTREQGDLERGLAHLDRAKMMFAALDDSNKVAICWNDIGIIHAYQKNLNEAQHCFEESLRLKREVGDKQGIAYAIGNLGVIAGQRGDTALERIMQEESLRLKRELGDAQGIANGLHALGHIAQDEGDFAAAGAHYRESLEVFYRLGRRWGMANIMKSIGQLECKCGHFERGLRLLSAAHHVMNSIKSKIPDDWFEALAHARTQSRLTPAEYTALEFEGEHLELNEAVEYALDWFDPFSTSDASREIGIGG